MKRAMPWSDQEDDLSSDDESSSLDSDTEAEENPGKTKATNNTIASRPSKEKTSEVKSGKRKSGVVDFETLRRHGYKGGLSVLSVPQPKEVDDNKHDWSWSTGKESGTAKETEETYKERQKTRAAIADGEQLTNVQTRKEKKNFSFSQKEKRKRDLGQASRGKNYVEEEKRLLRERGVYSGFDS